MGELRKMGPEGDTKMVWDADKKDEVEAIEETFNDLRAKGYFAYKVKKDGEKGRVITRFDPDAEKIIMALPMRGG